MNSLNHLVALAAVSIVSSMLFACADPPDATEKKAATASKQEGCAENAASSSCESKCAGLRRQHACSTEEASKCTDATNEDEAKYNQCISSCNQGICTPGDGQSPNTPTTSTTNDDDEPGMTDSPGDADQGDADQGEAPDPSEQPDQGEEPDQNEEPEGNDDSGDPNTGED